MAVTEGLLQVCTWDEVRGVLAHELAHVRNRDILIGSVAAAVATGISFAANMAMWGAMFGGGRDDDDGANPLVLLLTALLAPIAASLLQMAISRSRRVRGRPHRRPPRRQRRAARPGPREVGGVLQAGTDERCPARAQPLHRQPAGRDATSRSPTCSAPTPAPLTTLARLRGTVRDLRLSPS